MVAGAVILESIVTFHKFPPVDTAVSVGILGPGVHISGTGIDFPQGTAGFAQMFITKVVHKLPVVGPSGDLPAFGGPNLLFSIGQNAFPACKLTVPVLIEICQSTVTLPEKLPEIFQTGFGKTEINRST